MPREKVFTTSVKAMFELEIREGALSRLHSLVKLQEPGLTCTCISRLVTDGEEWAYENNNPHPHAYTPVHLALNNYDNSY